MNWFKRKAKRIASVIPSLRFKFKSNDPKVWTYKELWAYAPTGLYKRTENDGGGNDESYVYIMSSNYQRSTLMWMVPNRSEMFIMNKDSDCGEYVLMSRSVHLTLEVSS